MMLNSHIQIFQLLQKHNILHASRLFVSTLVFLLKKIAKNLIFYVGVHFFIDDYRFERVWQNPERYTQYLEKHPFVVQPDFSTYTDMPKIMQMWNKYRNHLLAWYWQNICGLDVVPNIMFSDEASFEWCFDGMPKRSTICISNVGVMQNKEWREAFAVGLTETIKRLSPTRILFYGTIPGDYDFGDIEVMSFKSRSFRKK